MTTARRKIILRNYQAPGDIVALTAAIRDLHSFYANRFLTDVRTSCPQLWENNPYLTHFREDLPLKPMTFDLRKTARPRDSENSTAKYQSAFVF